MKHKFRKQVKKPINTGFSLIELTVVLAIAAVIGLAIWKLLPLMRGTANVDTPRIALQEAQTAIEGFILRENRLPCPASSPNGVEDCTGNVQVGTLPYSTLGLSAGVALRYGVYRNAAAFVKNDADLAQAKQRYLPTSPINIIGAINGLDFCVGLKNAIASPNVLAASAGGVSIAYGLAHAGANGNFEGANADVNPSFELTSNAQTSDYDDKVIIAGHSELFGRLNCPQRLGNANGAARSLYAAFDNNLNAALYAEYREFVVQVREKNLLFAISTLAIASADFAIAGAGAATSIALAAATVGIGAGTVIGAGGAVAAATAAEIAAAAGVVSAGIALDKAKNQRDAANANKLNLTEPTLARATTAAIAAVKQGLLP
jgi:prepilin-type N-terminal cleavage/methylation domain-containing protein